MNDTRLYNLPDNEGGKNSEAFLLTDWFSGNSLAKELKVERNTINNKAAEIASEHGKTEDWIQKRKISNKITNVYHPDLVALIRLNAVPSVGDWFSANSLKKVLKLNPLLIHKIAVEIAKENGKIEDWIQKRKSKTILVDAYHPELVKLIFLKNIPLINDWLSASQLAGELKSMDKTIYKKAVEIATEHGKMETWIQKRRSGSKTVDAFHPDLALLIRLSLSSSINDWSSANSLTKVLKSNAVSIHKKMLEIAKEHGKMEEWIENRRNNRGKTVVAYHPDLVSLILSGSIPFVDNWSSAGSLSGILKSDRHTIHRKAVEIAKEHGKMEEWVQERRNNSSGGGGKIFMAYHPDLVSLMLSNQAPPIDNWFSAYSLKSKLNLNVYSISNLAIKIANEYGKTDEWVQKRRVGGGKIIEAYHPDLVDIILSKITPLVGNWFSIKSLTGVLKSDRGVIHRKALEIAKESGKEEEWIQNRRSTSGKVVVACHPNLVILLREFYALRNGPNAEAKENKLVEELKKFSQMVTEGLSVDIKNFRSFVVVFGSSRVIDLLFKFRPEFKDLPIERVKSCLAEYLGDFLSAKQEFRIKDVGAAAEFLFERTLREGLYETMKDHCLQYYFEKRRQGATGDSYEIIYNYLVHITEELHGVSNKFLDDVIEDVVSYFNSAIQEFKKPDKFVDRLSEDREFPDLNQRINMKELADKKRMLIADEMGLGKSASVIMAKEHLQLGCALVIVPKITERTWQDYLSDDAARKGYFKQGQAPRVLVVTSVADLDGVTKKDFDYIIISQAKLNGRYAMLLEELDPDMLIVDESHKFKNGKGVRTNVLLPLARKLEGSGKYLAMLTGTPIPNKVNDIAVALKLLYPDKFGDTPVGELATTIIRGDVIDLRSLLVPHMQMKELEDVVVMPKREQVSEGVTLSSAERDVYEALLELDEITAFEKMKALRTFLLNPELVGVEPGIRSSKFETLQNKLSETFKTKSKVLVVVNDYVSGIMRGKEFLFQQLRLPSDVSVEFIHGDDGSQSNENVRPDLQRRFNEGSEKMLLIVSGAAADVGISLVGAEETIIYNEPWTESDLKQQKARVFRQGLDHDITETIFIVKNSIEEGLHDYIAKKQKAIEKILKGIPISELEMRMVENAEKNKDGDVSEEDYEVNPELARHYFSVKHRLLLMFAHIKQRGEEEIRKFFETWGAEYAQGYREVGARSIQANANRVAGALISEMITASGRHPAALQILDVASGPEMLRRHCADMLQPSITSLDINKHHFENGTLGKTFVGGWTAMPFKDRTFDYLNCAMAFQDSEFVPSKNKYERLDVLREMNRVLQPGGRVVVNMIYSMEMNDMEKFRLFVEAIGFKIVADFTGIAEFEDQYYSQVITLEKIADSEKKSEEVVAEIGIEHRVGLKMHKTKKTLRNDRKILKYGFYLNGKSKPILLNSADQKVSHEENMIEDEIVKLKKVYKTIREIPVQEIIDRGYVRISLSKKYYLFKRLTTAPGIILLK